jgi:hypothetical protein
MDEGKRWLKAEDAATYVGVRVDQMRRLVRAGKVPAPSYSLGPKSPRWDRLALDAVFQVEQAKPTHVTSSGMASALLAEYNAKRRRKEQIKATSTVSRRPLNEPVSTRNGPLSHGEGAPRLG